MCRECQLLFAAHCVLWLVSITGSCEGVVNHMDTLREQAELEATSNPRAIRDK